MKTSTIDKILKKKVSEWLLTITDSQLANDVESNLMVTGGCIASMLLREDVNDYDIYISDRSVLKRLSQYYCGVFNASNTGRSNNIGGKLHAWVLDGADVDLWKQGKKELSTFAYDYEDESYCPSMEWDNENYVSSVSGMILNTSKDRIKIMVNSDGVVEDKNLVETLEQADEIDSTHVKDSDNLEYKPLFLSENAITLSGDIQVIIRFYGSPEEIHSNYDFSHTTNYWTFADGVVTNNKALEAILAKELFYNGSKYPITSIIRTRKFIKRGWNINAGQYLKMAMQISKLDLTNIYVLHDQLVGVDSIYFIHFIKTVQSDIENGKKTKELLTDGTYVMSVIDRIFK